MKTERDDILDMNKKRDLRDTEQVPIQSDSEAKMIVDGAKRDP